MKYLIIWQHFFRINNPPLLFILTFAKPCTAAADSKFCLFAKFFYRLLTIAFAATSSSVLQYTGMYVLVQNFEIWLPLRHKFCCLPEVFHFTQTSMKEPGLKKRNILLKRLSAPWNYAWPINNPVNYTILAGKKEMFLLGFCKIRVKITSSLRMELHITIFDSAYAHA